MAIMAKRIPYVSNFLNHPRMLIAVGFGCTSYFITQSFFHFRDVTDLVIAWNIGALIYMFLCMELIFSPNGKIKTRAKQHDENEWVILLISSLAAFSSIAAIIGELGVASKAIGFLKFVHIGMAVVTLLNSWSFIHLAFTLHYAHEYYSHTDWETKPAIIFPDTKEPNYFDFLYFSFVIGTSGQTADVAFGNTKTRRVGLIHCILAYLFNATILALMINIAASLIGS